ncbi:hypothetical protein [Streptomyces niveus]|uniref:hypothetical protein n=1 Tax=Streptomyces niveus TaxID=193462 RepID=UPI0036577907
MLGDGLAQVVRVRVVQVRCPAIGGRSGVSANATVTVDFTEIGVQALEIALLVADDRSTAGNQPQDAGRLPQGGQERAVVGQRLKGGAGRDQGAVAR